MEYNRNLTNSADDKSLERTYAPSPYPELSNYQIRSGPNSLVNLPCCISPQNSNYSNFSPRPYTPDAVGQRMRYHPYQKCYPTAFPPFDTTGAVDYRRHVTRNLFAGDRHGCTEVNNRNSFHPQNICQQNAKKYSSVNKQIPGGVTESKIRKQSKKKKCTPVENFPAQSISNNPQTNYYDHNIHFNYLSNRLMLEKETTKGTPVIDNIVQSNCYPNLDFNSFPNKVEFERKYSPQSTGNIPKTNYDLNIFLNDARNAEILTVNKEENACSPIATKQSHVAGNKNSQRENTENNLDNTEFSVANSNVIENGYIKQCANTNTSFMTEPQNDLLERIFAATVLSNTNGNQVKLQEGLTVNNESRNFGSVVNEQNYSVGENYSIGQVTGSLSDDTKKSTMTEETTFVLSAEMESNFTSQPQNDQIILNTIMLENTNVNGVQLPNHVDLSGYQLTHFTMPENSTFNIRDIKKLNNIDLSNSYLEPIFEGKDENGDGVIYLRIIDNSNTAQSIDPGSNNADSFVDKQNPIILNGQKVFNNISDNDEMDNKILSEFPVQEVNNEIDNTMFTSDMGDCTSEETVSTSKRKFSSEMKINLDDISRDKNDVEILNQTAKGNSTTSNYKFQSSTFKQRKNVFKNSYNHMNGSYNSHKGGNFHDKQRTMPPWRRRHAWKCNETVKSIQNSILKRFLRSVRKENEHMIVSEEFWHCYRLMVNQISGSVLQTMYKILPELYRYSYPSVSMTYGGASNSPSSGERSNGAAEFTSLSAERSNESIRKSSPTAQKSNGTSILSSPSAQRSYVTSSNSPSSVKRSHGAAAILSPSSQKSNGACTLLSPSAQRSYVASSNSPPYVQRSHEAFTLSSPSSQRSYVTSSNSPQSVQRSNEAASLMSHSAPQGSNEPIRKASLSAQKTNRAPTFSTPSAERSYIALNSLSSVQRSNGDAAYSSPSAQRLNEPIRKSVAAALKSNVNPSFSSPSAQRSYGAASNSPPSMQRSNGVAVHSSPSAQRSKEPIRKSSSSTQKSNTASTFSSSSTQKSHGVHSKPIKKRLQVENPLTLRKNNYQIN